MWARSTAWLSEGRQQKPSITTTFNTGVLLLQRSRERSPSRIRNMTSTFPSLNPTRHILRTILFYQAAEATMRMTLPRAVQNSGFAVPFTARRLMSLGG